MTFNTTLAVDLPLLGTTAVPIQRPMTPDPSGHGRAIPRARAVKVTNTHATALVYVARNRVATATDYDMLVDGTTEAPILNLRPTDTYISVIASGASTPVGVQFGNTR